MTVCIVTYETREYLKECLESLFANAHPEGMEVIVVDNASRDGTAGLVAKEYPQVRFHENQANAGYSRPMNQALRMGSGRFLLQLNPDTHILPGALDRLVALMEAHPEIGICGPKVLNRDRSFQQHCRRGDPRPWAVISYFLGLNRVFPKSRFFGGYLLNYLDEDQPGEVENVSGSCMLIRREVLEQIGFLDEAMYAYQEDSDLCFRARRAGWRIYFLPEAQIIHYGGQGGSRVEPYRSIIEWHRSYWLYYRKHLAKDYFFLFNWFYYLLMLAKLGVALLINLVRREKFAGPSR